MSIMGQTSAPMGAGGAAGITGGGFSFGSLLSNPMVLQMMASMGAGLDPKGPGGTIGGVTNQWIQNKSYLDMMKKMLAGGAKMTLDGKANTFNIGGESSALGSLLGSDDNKSQGFQMDNWDSVA